jgi:hypothetical protein
MRVAVHLFVVMSQSLTLPSLLAVAYCFPSDAQRTYGAFRVFGTARRRLPGPR